ncbi:MAG: Crp/Fnr family transcriptional regulator [Gammaproteobacteria bacterium]|nr:Crp/Fnr family transcriptional regulator [Gammaproteobacteria bacterium]MBK81161.1 Crp/Fnr family transcriptional regulator [Gammaproteobacteria bacterium]|tara:strand:+ start:2444 stop:3139 length:696 start_codon:yes stop_codon:yes gene_type:complete
MTSGAPGRRMAPERLAELIPAFAADDALLALLHDAGRTVTVPAGQYVFRAGDACQAFLLLLDGRVRVQITAENGREVTLYRLGSGGSCLLTTSCLLGGDHYPAEAVVEQDAAALVLPWASFQTALDRSPAFRRFVFDGFASRLTHVIRKLEQITFTGVDARLAAALLEHSEGGAGALTHQHLAVELGTAREVVSRHLKRFETAGWVRLGRSRIDILDPDRLTALAAPALGD